MQRASFSALLLAAAVLPSVSSAAERADGMVRREGAAMLPTGEDVRLRGTVASDMAAAPIGALPPSERSGAVRTLSLAPGPLSFSSRFGWRADPLGGGARFHAGVDIPARPGAAVRAVRAGRVMFSGPAGGYGNLVVIDHGGGVRSRYGHLERALVAAGDLVGTGTRIGEVGSTGRSTGPHLHYEVRIGGTAVDPLRAVLLEPEGRAFDLVWPGTDAPMAAVAPRWSWSMADQEDVLPVPIMR